MVALAGLWREAFEAFQTNSAITVLSADISTAKAGQIYLYEFKS